MDHYNSNIESEIETNVSKLNISFESSFEIAENHRLELLCNIQCEQNDQISESQLIETVQFSETSQLINNELNNLVVSFDSDNSEVFELTLPNEATKPDLPKPKGVCFLFQIAYWILISLHNFNFQTYS